MMSDNAFDLPIHKKKKKRIVSDSENTPRSKDDDDDSYTYEEMLRRVYAMMPPEKVEMLNADRVDKIRVPAPSVARFGGKRIAIMNFARITTLLHRKPEHVQQYFVSEMSISSSSIDQNGALILKCQLRQGQIETLLIKYIAKYVRCYGCKSMNTNIVNNKELRQEMTQCNNCHSSISLSEKSMLS